MLLLMRRSMVLHRALPYILYIYIYICVLIDWMRNMLQSNQQLLQTEQTSIRNFCLLEAKEVQHKRDNPGLGRVAWHLCEAARLANSTAQDTGKYHFGYLYHPSPWHVLGQWFLVSQTFTALNLGCFLVSEMCSIQDHKKRCEDRVMWTIIRGYGFGYSPFGISQGVAAENIAFSPSLSSIEWKSSADFRAASKAW